MQAVPHSLFLRLVMVTFLIIFHWAAEAQLYFQLERAGSLKVRKYSPGDPISFQTRKIPDEWQSGTILEILPREEALVFDDRITYIADINRFRYKRPWPNVIGASLFRFGIAWFVFAGIIEGGRRAGVLDTNYSFGTDTAIIGASAISSGFLIRELWAEAVLDIGTRHRVRIIDLRF